MLSKGDSKKKPGGSSGDEKLLKDVETISKSLYADKTLPPRLASSTASSRSRSVGKFHSPEPKTKPEDTKKKNPKDLFEKDKKPSGWGWKILKAFTYARDRRFNCRFSLLVHSVEDLPPSFDDLFLVVHWKRRDSDQMTIPVKVYEGLAKFEEQLTHSCSVYGTRSGPNHSVKYEARHFSLYVSVYNAPEVDMGKHGFDLTRFLPLTLEELEEKKSSEKWTTSFKLSGEARGATMNVSFGYSVIENNAIMPSDKMNDRSIRRARSFAVMSDSDLPAEDIKELHEVLPVPRSELTDSVNILYQKLDQEMSNTSAEHNLEADSLSLPESGDKNWGTECEMMEVSVSDKGIEELTKDHVKLEDESSKIAQDSGDGLEEADFAFEVALDEVASLHSSALEGFPQNGEQSISTCTFQEGEDDICSKESLMKELEEALSCTLDLVNEELDSHEDDSDALHLQNYLEVDFYDTNHRKGKSISLDDVTDSIASDFLEMLEHSPFSLSSESEPESPRERLLRQFEKDTLANGGLLNFDIIDDQSELVENITTNAFQTKTRASMMEDLESEALMREMGFNETAFQRSPSSGSDGFGSSIDISPEDPLQLPSLAEGVGPFVQTKDGGFLRSMNPALFVNSKNGGSVIMQVSNPVVVPAEMGSCVMDVLRGLASAGIEKLSVQANRLMPLEDITGKSIQQIAWDSASSLEGLERQDLLQQEPEIMQNMPCEEKSVKRTSSISRSSKFDWSSNSSDTEYVSLEDLAPLAMDKIQALSIEGLRIQSGMSDDDAPSNISANSIGELSALKGKTVDVGGSIGLDGTCGLQLMDVKDNGEDVDGLMGLSLTLDEWTKLDSGEINDDDLVSERTSKILAAHHATSLDQFRGRSKGDKKQGRSTRKYGLLGNNFTVALMVQLRNPLRNYEPVGTPMLALVQVERVFVPPKPKIYGTLSLARESDEDEGSLECDKNEEILEEPKEEEEEEKIPRYKITEVHVAGLKTEQGRKKKSWGSTKQQQSGSRWLLANGMGKKNKHLLMKLKSKAVATGSAPAATTTTTTTVQPGDTLWSISSRVYGTGDKWKELAALNPHIRNPNVIFPNETIKLR